MFECSLSFNLLISKFYPPTTQTFRCLIVWVGLGWVGVGVWVWAYLHFQIFLPKKREIYVSFFFKCLQLTGGTILNFFTDPILELKNRKWVQKLTIFGQIDICVLAILGVQKFRSKNVGRKNAIFIFPFF